MKTSMFHEYKLSQLMLGTGQFGANYGIANKSGRPSYQTVLKILECAAANGVNCLDTAPGYGDSEEVIGKAMRELGLADNLVVVTKVPAMDDNLKPAQADNFVEEAVAASLERLQLNILPICLFHQERDMVYADSLCRMKAKGLVKHIGISANSPEWALNAIRSGHFETIQIPSSILDHRYFRTGVFHEAGRNGVALFIRSIYLQGLLFLPETEMPAQLSPVIDVRCRLKQLAEKANMNLTEMAVRFAMRLKGVYCLVIGLETVEQLQVNLKYFEQGALSEALFHDILEAVPQLPESVIVPSLWPKMVR